VPGSQAAGRGRLNGDLPMSDCEGCLRWVVVCFSATSRWASRGARGRGRPDGTLADMNQVIAWVGFLGAWLLVAGPLYQGALELLEEDIDREGIDASIARVPRPAPPSPWWWLLPPVMYLIRRHRRAAFRQAALAQLTQAQRDQTTSFVNKATGWFTVALGAALLAAEQTWQVIERQHWAAWLFWVLIIVMLGVSVLNTSLKIHGRAAEPAAQRAHEDSPT
jgi:hypothetical protein